MEELILLAAKLIEERDDLIADGDDWVELMDGMVANLEAAQIAHAELVEGVSRLMSDIGTDSLNAGVRVLGQIVRERLGELIDGK